MASRRQHQEKRFVQDGISVVLKKLIEWKEKRMMGRLTIAAVEIMVLINYAWEMSFQRVIQNQTAIADRGWHPLTRNLLLNTQLQSTMTDIE